MRMWMVDPKVLCDQHLLGEHVELHMIIGSIRKRIKLDGYVENNLLEFKSIYTRHNELREEMKKRGMNHKSPLPELNESDRLHQTEFVRESIVDISKSLNDLITRCPKCKSRNL